MSAIARIAAAERRGRDLGAELAERTAFRQHQQKRRRARSRTFAYRLRGGGHI
ncbi:MAG: hypothetical protein KGM42_13810 [Hyphomicrobiales bacterium]|nr:hypothetical protein [Hyphomicrobiales bacterium]